jgi:hypothetical protein
MDRDFLISSIIEQGKVADYADLKLIYVFIRSLTAN